ncbi:MAG: hypothetical protein AVDCRST_MAG72-634 [uncultured Nocardioidaceae bacterium]|uniref:Secreted protein n=1 Tax=uncultured Nocardioidaceae bacterium TaxID=253824 RepID=A0A6J4LRK7_9ACTN|nr:MAG: hypothetical protein AVDCRST_MAG72-634 [uncultured Nocardioidaceae bacterium]
MSAMTSTISRSRPRALSAMLVTVALAVAGCSGSLPGGDDDPDDQSTAAGASLSGRWPLTGLPASGAAPRHPVMVVKIDNTSSSRPQVGLGQADLVAEELVEGGVTRLAVFYYSKLPRTVGPVRSIRATDIGIVKPANAALVASGGAPPTVRRVKQAKIRTLTEGAAGYYRDGGRTSPYNLFNRLPKLAATLKSARTPDSYFPWGDEKDFPAGQRASGLSAQFSTSHTTNWRYRRGSYLNVNSQAKPNDQFSPKTVLVLRVRIGDAGYRDPAGNPVPETRFTGKGQALVFHGGKVVRGTWRKAGLDATVSLETKGGKELSLPAGRVWMELVPVNGGNVTIRR